MDYHDKTLKAVTASLKSIEPHKSIVICPQKTPTVNGIESIEVPITHDYSYWILKNLKNYINTDYCIVQQWDSAVINENKWSNDFLSYDYIGAPWETTDSRRVGNGGFSLRSKKFLEESSKIANLLPVGKFILGNEDYFACVIAGKYLEMKGVKFAPVETARNFSVERIVQDYPHDYNDLSTYNSFGFHGDFNGAGMEKIKQ